MAKIELLLAPIFGQKEHLPIIFDQADQTPYHCVNDLLLTPSSYSILLFPIRK
jgi:hypothetical protein